MKILSVEDDPKIASFIVGGLRQAGYVVTSCSDGQEGFTVATTEPFDLMIVDIMLPKLDGLSLIDQLRAAKINTPVIILSAKRSVEDRVVGLQRGGDDYITKPFAFSELLARIQSVTRRAIGASETTRLCFADVEMDLLTRKVSRGGKALNLQPREFALLEFLMRNAGRVVSKTMIMEHVWDYNFDPQTNVVEARICRLREKIDDGSSSKLLHTIRGVGYVFGPES